jgi:hypothetical protein
MRGGKRGEMYDKSEAEIGGRRYPKYFQRYLTERRLFRWQECGGKERLGEALVGSFSVHDVPGPRWTEAASQQSFDGMVGWQFNSGIHV